MFGWGGHAVDDFLQPGQRVAAVHVLGAVLLGLENEHAVLRDAAVVQAQQTLLHTLGQAGGVDVKAQMDGAGDLVHVLPARTLCADRGHAHFGFVDGQGRCHT